MVFSKTIEEIEEAIEYLRKPRNRMTVGWQIEALTWAVKEIERLKREVNNRDEHIRKLS